MREAVRAEPGPGASRARRALRLPHRPSPEEHEICALPARLRGDDKTPPAAPPESLRLRCLPVFLPRPSKVVGIAFPTIACRPLWIAGDLTWVSKKRTDGIVLHVSLARLQIAGLLRRGGLSFGQFTRLQQSSHRFFTQASYGYIWFPQQKH